MGAVCVSIGIWSPSFIADHIFEGKEYYVEVVLEEEFLFHVPINCGVFSFCK
jgi:hypothetical protein